MTPQNAVPHDPPKLQAGLSNTGGLGRGQLVLHALFPVLASLIEAPSTTQNTRPRTSILNTELRTARNCEIYAYTRTKPQSDMALRKCGHRTLV